LGATSCLHCIGGNYLQSSVCTNCSVGMFSYAGSSACTNCAAGYFQRDPGASECIG
jgi:hypothetical protein